MAPILKTSVAEDLADSKFAANFVSVPEGVLSPGSGYGMAETAVNS
jgi:hypothetical protein